MSLAESPAEQAARGAALSARIRQRIAEQGGWLRFDAFMRLALYEPALGYYTRATGSPFGAEGDFITAPELGPLYAQALAQALAPLLAGRAGQVLLEAGAGSGRLAVDLLAELERLDALPERYLILELSEPLRARQRERVGRTLAPALAARVAWLDAPPARYEGVVVANELIDALPVRLLVKAGEGVLERGVVVEGEGFGWADRPPDAGLAALVEARLGHLVPDWPEAYCTEVCAGLDSWLAGLVAGLERGTLWFGDYGYGRADYYAPTRGGGTLVCHHRHQAGFDPLVRVGLQDITAFVDFTALAEAADALGLRVAGYTTQAHFLLDCGIDRLLARHAEDPPAARARLAQQAQRLLLPGEMGERFKVMALTRDWAGPLRGFGFADHRHRL